LIDGSADMIAPQTALVLVGEEAELSWLWRFTRYCATPFETAQKFAPELRAQVGAAAAAVAEPSTSNAVTTSAPATRVALTPTADRRTFITTTAPKRLRCIPRPAGARSYLGRGWEAVTCDRLLRGGLSRKRSTGRRSCAPLARVRQRLDGNQRSVIRQPVQPSDRRLRECARTHSELGTHEPDRRLVLKVGRGDVLVTLARIEEQCVERDTNLTRFSFRQAETEVP